MDYILIYFACIAGVIESPEKDYPKFCEKKFKIDCNKIDQAVTREVWRQALEIRPELKEDLQDKFPYDDFSDV